MTEEQPPPVAAQDQTTLNPSDPGADSRRGPFSRACRAVPGYGGGRAASRDPGLEELAVEFEQLAQEIERGAPTAQAAVHALR